MIKRIMLFFLILILAIVGFFFVGSAPEQEEQTFGVNFSQKHAQNLGLDWKETYTALIEELGVKNIKVASYWDLIEPEDGKYDFEDLDWQLEVAKNNGVDVMLVLGMKTPRWPECHLPEWAKGLDKEKQQEEILELIREMILRYKDFDAISMWQVENEPFFPFGECVWSDPEFLKEEVALVKSLDSKARPILISDSGEGSFWFRASSIGDVVGTTMYRKVWVWQFKTYVTYPLPPVFYWRKAEIIKKFFNKEVICVELQAEPWGPELLYTSPLSEQEKTMNLERFQNIVSFAKKTGLKKFYLWGAEWWYWMKEINGQGDIWEEAKKLF